MVRVKQRLDLDDGGGGYGMVLMAAHRPVSGTCSRLFGTNETLKRGRCRGTGDEMLKWESRTGRCNL